jgi:hypothetical protein
MLVHPSIHFEISRQRQREVLAWTERYRLTKEARTATQDEYRRLIEARALWWAALVGGRRLFSRRIDERPLENCPSC